jgi:hypothetical protein
MIVAKIKSIKKAFKKAAAATIVAFFFKKQGKVC